MSFAHENRLAPRTNVISRFSLFLFFTMISEFPFFQNSVLSRVNGHYTGEYPIWSVTAWPSNWDWLGRVFADRVQDMDMGEQLKPSSPTMSFRRQILGGWIDSDSRLKIIRVQLSHSRTWLNGISSSRRKAFTFQQTSAEKLFLTWLQTDRKHKKGKKVAETAWFLKKERRRRWQVVLKSSCHGSGSGASGRSWGGSFCATISSAVFNTAHNPIEVTYWKVRHPHSKCFGLFAWQKT